jgi:spore coat protein H
MSPIPLLLSVCLLVANALPAWSAEGRSRGTNSASGKEDDPFAHPRVYHFKIELGDSALESLRKQPHQYVKATLTEGTTTYSGVGIRVKGGTNAPSIDKKPGLSVKFNEFAKGQAFHGHNRFLLNHSQSDPTYLAEAIAGDVFRAAGVPAGRVTFARVELNGRDLGLYVVGEAMNRDFLTQYFKKTKGNLYEGSNADITEKLEKDSGDSSSDQSDLRALAKAAQEPDLAERWKKLGQVLDLDRFLSFVAGEVLVWHQEGYALAHHEYRIYHDPASDHFVFLPHDIGHICAKTDGPIIPEWQGLVAKAVISTPAGQKQYLERVAKVLNDAFKVDALQHRVDELATVVRPALAEGDATALKAFEAALPQLRDRMAKRAAFAQRELESRAK